MQGERNLLVLVKKYFHLQSEYEKDLIIHILILKIQTKWDYLTF
jgi:hypothetical protein